MKIENKASVWATAIMASVATGCGDDSTGGSLSVLLEAEDTITEGLRAGDGDEDIVDGYNVTFEKYFVSIGNVDMSQQNDANPESSSVVAIADFTSLPEAQEELFEFTGIATGQYVNFAFETPTELGEATNFNDVPEEDFNAMVEKEWSYIIEGTISPEDDPQSVKRFLIEADVPAVYFACEFEGEQGVNVQSSSSVELTLHGDHIFFNGFPEEETEVVRLAQWLWDIPDDGDELLTKDDFMEATNTEELFPSSQYTLTGGPIEEINNAWDFIRAQLATQGHINGEGECEWTPL